MWLTPAGGCLLLAVVVSLAHIAWILSGKFDLQAEQLIGSLILVFINVLFVIFSLFILRNRDFTPRLRHGWLLLAVAVLCNALADSLWMYYNNFLQVDPFPSPADLFYLCYYPLTLAGLMLFPFAPETLQERFTFWLDLLIILTVCVMIFWYFILAYLVISPSEGLAQLVAVAYPIGDLLILTGVITLLQRDIEKIARWALTFLTIGLVLMAVADGLFAYYEATGIRYQIAYIDIFWITSTLFNCLAAFWQMSSEVGTTPSSNARLYVNRRLLQLALPYLAVLVSILLLLWVIRFASSLDYRLLGLIYGNFILVGLVLLRQYLVLRENVNLYQFMRQMAITDNLTGLYNRHYFNEVFLREIERARRYGNPLTVLLLDVDHFKKINDTYGHLQGDEVLKMIAQLLRSHLRAADLIARFGGDEFVIALPETTLEKAHLVADRLSKAVANYHVGHDALGISAGLAAYRPNLSPEQLLEEADQDLYHQKNLLRASPSERNVVSS